MRPHDIERRDIGRVGDPPDTDVRDLSIMVVDESELALVGGFDIDDRRGDEGADRIHTGNAGRPLQWWIEADRLRRATISAAVVAVLLAAATIVLAVQAHHRDVTVTRIVPAAPPAAVDALGCPVATICRVVGAPRAVAAVRDALVVATVSAQMVVDAKSPSTVYARTVLATGLYNNLPADLYVVSRCGVRRRRTVAAQVPTSDMAMYATMLTQIYTQRYDGDCSVTAWSRYAVTFTAGGYPEPSLDVVQIVEAMATNPDIRL